MSARTFLQPGLRFLAASTLLLLAAIAAAPQETSSAELPPNASPEAHLSRGYEALKLDQYEVAVREFQAALAG